MCHTFATGVRTNYIHSLKVYCTALFCIALYRTVLYCTTLYCTALHCTVLYCTALYCTALHCTVLYCTALYCTALNCMVFYVHTVRAHVWVSVCARAWVPTNTLPNYRNEWYLCVLPVNYTRLYTLILRLYAKNCWQTAFTLQSGLTLGSEWQYSEFEWTYPWLCLAPQSCCQKGPKCPFAKRPVFNRLSCALAC